MELFLFISLALTLFYTGIMFVYLNKWNDTEVIEHLPFVQAPVSVIIPARNEAGNILNILEDITVQDYPKELIDVIVIDDHSTDDTFSLVSDFAQKHSFVRIYKLEELKSKDVKTQAFKKEAIEHAVSLAKGTLIITTDADCRVQTSWIRSIAGYYNSGKHKLIAAPVCFSNDHTSFEKFQALDFCGMQAITAASLRMHIYNMANGANLAYEKDAFLQVNGYQDIRKKASGDDMLLVYKIAKKFPGQVAFLKSRDAMVYTEPCRTLKEFLQQRFRWTSKSASYQDKRMTLILGCVYLFVVSIWVNAFYFFGRLAYTMVYPDHSLTGLFMFLDSLLFLLVLIFQLVVKSITDYLFLRSAANFFGREDLMKNFFRSELLHMWYIPFVGTFGNLLQYNWKGRKLN